VLEEEFHEERLLQPQEKLFTALPLVSFIVLQLTQAKDSGEAPIAMLVALSHEHNPVALSKDIVPKHPQLFCLLLEAFKNLLEVFGQLTQLFD
jgi:hypothetical protein